MMLLSAVACVSVGLAVEPTPPAPTPGPLIFDPFNPAVQHGPTDPFAVFTQVPQTAGPVLTTPPANAPVTLGSVTLAPATTPVSIPPPGITFGSDGCLQLNQSSQISLVPTCDSPGGQAVTTAVKVISFAEDPLGFLADKMGQGASGIMSWIADTANNATSADLTNNWWVDAYRKAFAIAIILFGALTMWNMVELGRHKIGPEEFASTITTRAWGFFAGVIFGPALAQFMIQGAGLLSRAIIASMPGYNGGKMDATTVNQSIQGASEGKIIGGVFIAFLLLLMVCICAIFLFVSLAVQTFAIYAAGAVFPIAFTWIINVKHRGGSMKIPFVVLGIIFGRPLLFFIVGLVMAMARASIVQTSDDAARNLAMVIMVGVGLAIAAFSPLLLLKFAPVIPTGTSHGTGHAASVSSPGVASPGVTGRLQNLSSTKSAAKAAPGGAGKGGGSSSSPVHAAAAAAGASPSGTSGAGGRRGLGKGKAVAPGGTPSAAAAASLLPGGGRIIDGAAAPKKPGLGARAGAAVRNAPAAALRGAKKAPATAKGIAKKTPGAIGRGAVAGAKAAPAAAWKGAKLAGKGAAKAAPVAGAVGAGAASGARRVGHGLGNGVGGDDKW